MNQYHDYISSGRSVSDLKAHLVLTTKYRRRVFATADRGDWQPELAERVNKFYGKSELWNESYFIASCGGVTVSVLNSKTPLARALRGHRTPSAPLALIPTLPFGRARGFPPIS
ncbi:MAG: hypothetical protein ACK4HM_03405 [Thermosynechococcus sp.]